METADKTLPSLGHHATDTPSLAHALDHLHGLVLAGASEFTNSELAARCHMPSGRFSREFKETLGVSPKRYLEALQTHLMVRLVASDVKVRDIAHVLGIPLARIYRQVRLSTGRSLQELRDVSPEEAVAHLDGTPGVLPRQGDASLLLLRARQRRRRLDSSRRVVRALLRALRATGVDAPPTIARLAREAGMRWEHFTRTVTALLGMPPSRVLRLEGEERQRMGSRMDALLTELA